MIEILQRIGLTRGESEVYITLLKTGNTSSGRLIKDSGVSRSKVYEVLERLKQKGLVTEMIKQNVKYFTTLCFYSAIIISFLYFVNFVL